MYVDLYSTVTMKNGYICQYMYTYTYTGLELAHSCQVTSNKRSLHI